VLRRVVLRRDPKPRCENEPSLASATDSVIGKDESEETGEESRRSRTVEIKREEENEVC